MRRTLTALLVTTLVVLAGCSAGPAGDTTATLDGTGTDATTAADAGDSSTPDRETTDAMPSGDGDASASAGVDFYVSDRPSVIGDFDHLNVTVTKVGVHRTGAGAGADGDDAANATEDGSESGEWLEFDVNATADLTRLQGANASKLGTLDLPNGTYTKVFVYVSETEGVIDGESRRVKLPSDKLQLHKGFTVGDGADVDFVFDIAVHRAGKSGKYVLSPVVSESGTGDEVEIRDVDADETPTDAASEDEAGDERGDEDAVTATPTTTATQTNATATPVE